MFRQATIILDSGQKMQVALKSVSGTGARIEFFTTTELPNEFTLSVPTLRINARARVAWQRSHVAGLKFAP